MIRYGRWIKLATPEAEFTPALLAPVFEVLEQKLDAAKEPSAAVREMFGMQFRTLAWLDLEWFYLSSRSCFRAKTEQKRKRRLIASPGIPISIRWAGAGNSAGDAQTLPMAIKALQKGDDVVGENNRTLASHLMQYYGI